MALAGAKITYKNQFVINYRTVIENDTLNSFITKLNKWIQHSTSKLSCTHKHTHPKIYSATHQYVIEQPDSKKRIEKNDPKIL